MSSTWPFFALALAAALLDVTLGYPRRLARWIGAPAQGLKAWLSLVREAGASWPGAATLALYLAPLAIGAVLISFALPRGPIGFSVEALLASVFCGRQALDRRASAVARSWESEGLTAVWVGAEALDACEDVSNLSCALNSALAGRFADEAVAPSLFIALTGLPGGVICSAIVVAGRMAGARQDAFARAAEALTFLTIRPAAVLAAIWLLLAAGRAPRLRFTGKSPVRPAETAMLAALGDGAPEHASAFRRAIALYRRAAAFEIAMLAALALASALLS